MCCSYDFLAVKRLMTTATFLTENIPMGLVYNFRIFVHYHHGGECVYLEAVTVLKKELRVLQLDPKASGNYVPHWE